MSDTAAKKVRSSNLSYAEKCLLVELCYKYQGVVENKKTDALNAKMKEDGWRQLTADFQAQAVGGTKREWLQLKNVCIFVVLYIMII